MPSKDTPQRPVAKRPTVVDWIQYGLYLTIGYFIVGAIISAAVTSH